MDVIHGKTTETRFISARYDDGSIHPSASSDSPIDARRATWKRTAEMRRESLESHSRPRVQNGDPPHLKTMENIKGLHGQDSDVDSGIVACEKSGQRIGSTSSADTDSSQESRHQMEYCSPLPKCDLRTNAIQLRAVRRASCLTSSSGPVKADHTVLKECNRRPPTPLTVFPDAQHSVRFDEQLQLSEQSLRRSCRKLFATLYGHRFSYPSTESNSPAPQTKESDEQESFRARSQTLPEEEFRKHYAILKNSNLYHPMNASQACDNVGKENLATCNRKAVSWNLQHPAPKMMEQMNSSNYAQTKQVSVSSSFPQSGIVTADKTRVQNRTNQSCSFKTSTDSGLGLCRPRCTCHNAVRGSGGSSSQSSTTSSSSNHYATCPPTSATPEIATTENRSTLFKSNSCSTLSSMLQQIGHPVTPELTKYQPPVQTSANSSPRSVSLQKTSSCSNLIDRTQMYPVAVYNDNMIHVYAEVASVVPDDSDDTHKQELASRTVRKNSYDGYHIYDTVKSPPPSMSVPASRPVAYGSTVGTSQYPLYQAPRRTISNNMPGYGGKESLRSAAQNKMCEIQRPGTPSNVGQYISMDSRLVPYRNRSYRENSQKSAVAMVRPTSISTVRPHSGIPAGYLKPALKQSMKTTSQQNVHDSTPDVGRIMTEVEYAVVDKSKKNRFTSLPTLNKFSSNGCIPGEEKDQPPVPPKKHLHKSDFSLYRSRSSSPRKSFFEKVHVLTKNARDVLQKAFSTERIYRPEREERLEATGQKLTRSKSFIKGLRASISRKRKKNKSPLMTEVVPQASSNPVWDEQPSGPNSPVHVRGQLLQLNLDGSQVIELSKPHNKPYGFFVARGRVRSSKGVFVSRMRDQETQKQLAGLLDIGDEILEIEGLGVKDADIIQVNDLMANKNTLLLTVLPYICRKDI